jgi:hypothetical protein
MILSCSNGSCYYFDALNFELVLNELGTIDQFLIFRGSNFCLFKKKKKRVN